MRALSSLVLLAGFYLVALIELLAAGVVLILLADSVGFFALSFFKPVFILLIGGVGAGLWKAIRTRDVPPDGVRISEQDAPELWATVRELATEVCTQAPQEIVLVAEVNAAVHEKARLLGLIGGKRTLCVGVPLLLGLRVDQMRAVLAHELGHYSGRHTRLAGVAYRGRLAIGHALSGVSNVNIAAWPLKFYARLYLLVDNTVSQRQELEADHSAVRLAGRDAAASALREIPVLDTAWSFYFSSYVEAGWEAGNVPDDLFGGFTELLAARSDELQDLRAEAPDKTPSRWDTHPPIGVRIQTIMAAPEDGRPADDRPATVLVADPVETRRRAQQELIASAGRTALSWPDFTHAAITARMQEQVDRMFRAISRSTGVNRPGLPEVLDLIEQDRLTDLAQPLFPNTIREELPGEFTKPLTLMLQLAAIRSHALRWRHSWSSPAELLTPDGQELDLAPIAELAVTDPVKARTALADLGIEIAAAAVQQDAVSASDAELLAGLAKVKVDKANHDLFVLSRGLLLIPTPRLPGDDKRRLRKLIKKFSPEELVARGTFIPFEELSDAEVHRETPLKATLLHHTGRRIELAARWTGETLTKDSEDVLVHILKQLHLKP